MKYLPILGLTVAIVCYADIATAKTPAEIEAIARAVTVEIRLLQAETVGSGIIVERQGDLYTLVTNRHVVCGQTRKCKTPPAGETYTVKLGDGQKYQVSAKSVKLLGDGLDLAIVQFRSDRGYPVAIVAEPGSLKVEDAVYTSGYPAEQPGFSFNAGLAIAVVDKRLTEDRGGYTVIYDAQTQPGMSGGGVFNQDGLLVAIHGQGERYQDNTQLESIISIAKPELGSKIGYNRGIPIKWVVQGLVELGIKLGNRQPVNLGQTAASSADEHFITGFNKLVEPGTDILAGKRLAIGEFSQAIKMKPRYVIAYYQRAFTYYQLQEARLALADYDRAIALDPKFAAAYYNRGNLKALRLNDPNGALVDFDRAIALNPQTASTYLNRGYVKVDKLNDTQGALADFDRAIALAPNLAPAYNNRGSLKVNKINDTQSALNDFNRAITLDPKYTFAYNNRGYLKDYKLNDLPGALADFNEAISLDPKISAIYNNRGKVRYKLNDPNGALADFNEAISLDPKNFLAYNSRGYLKAGKFNDTQGALADFDRAISLNSQFAEPYNNRGKLKAGKFNDPNGALVDFDRAISLNSQFAEAYNNRGFLKQDKLNNTKGAVADYERAIALEPKFAAAYFNRGNMKQYKLNNPQGALSDYDRAIALNAQFANAYGARGELKCTKLGDKSGGIADIRQAAKLARAQSNFSYLKLTLQALQLLGVGE